MRLADFITSNLENILQEWQDYAQSIDSTGQMNAEELRDHAKNILLLIAGDLRTTQTEQQGIAKSRGERISINAPRRQLDTQSHQHGFMRLESGFDIEKTVSEFRALRASVLRLWGKAKHMAQQTDLDDMLRFNEAIDQVVAESVAGFAHAGDQRMRLFETILSSSPDHSCILDLDGKFIYANRALADVLRRPQSELIGCDLFDLHLEDAAELHQQVQHAIRTKKPFIHELLYRPSAGVEGVYEYIFTPVINPGGQVEAVAGTARDITVRKAAAEEAWRTANYDLLTGLPNRRLFHDRLEQEVKHAERTGMAVALLFIDLDRFKEANDSLGHDAGDLLLRQAAERIRLCIRQKDTVARLGGDEFTVILTDIGATDQVKIVAEKILAELARPFSITQEIVHISCSIGIARYPQHARTPDHLIHYADQAMYAAKSDGRNRYAFYTEELKSAERARSTLIADLRDAMPQAQLVVYYQPIVDLSDGRIRKAEALLRWQHPQIGLVLPGEFLGLAEETGMIGDIGNWVFAQAASHAHEWQTMLGQPFQVSINMSPLQLSAAAHSTSWDVILKKIGLASNSISIEISEDVLLDVTGEAANSLAKLQRAGIELGIDDFGTGYSSMTYLKKVDARYLKIDHSLVQQVPADKQSRMIVETITVMAHKLGLKVVAEGVETSEQRDWITHAGCDYAQGFLFGQPLPVPDFTRLLQSTTVHQMFIPVGKYRAEE
jgi:diguanylate cyclase (GGDEF)-like protein/PAS domain S-box-containing protein